MQEVIDAIYGQMYRFEITQEEAERRFRAMMSGEEFIDIHSTPELQEYILTTAAQFTRCEETQEDLIQEAWLRVAEWDGTKSVEFYKKEAFRGIEAAYRRWYRRSDRRLNGRRKDPEKKRAQTRARVRKYRLKKKAIAESEQSRQASE